jgi:hypothetical protein
VCLSTGRASRRPKHPIDPSIPNAVAISEQRLAGFGFLEITTCLRRGERALCRTRLAFSSGGRFAGIGQQRATSHVIVRWNDAYLVAERVQPMQGLKTQVAIFVGEPARIACLLPNVVNLVRMPGSIAGQQNPSALGVGQYPDAARSMAPEVDKNDTAVAE